MDSERIYKLQEERETKCHQIGIDRFQAAIKEAEERMYSSHHLAGRMCITTTIDALIKYINPLFFKASPRRKKDGSRGKPPVAAHAAAMYHCTVDLTAPQATYIALMTMMDAAGLTKRIALDPKEHTQMEWSAVERLVGERLEKEALLKRLSLKFPFVYNLLKTESFLKNSGTDQKINRLRKGFEKKANRIRYFVGQGNDFNNPETGEVIPFTQELAEHKLRIADEMTPARWTKAQRQAVGAWFVQKIVDKNSPCAGWFVLNEARDGKKKRQYMQYSASLKDIISGYHASGLAKAFFLLPMLVPPGDWEPPSERAPKGVTGGFLYDALIASRTFIRGHSRKSEIGPMTYDFINEQQRKPFKLNQWIIKIQQGMIDRNWVIENDKFCPWRMPDEDDRPKLPAEYQGLPRITEDMADDLREEVLAKRKKRDSIKEMIRQWFDRQAELRELSRPTIRYWEIIQQIKDDEQFYFPWSIDNRTRCYPLVDGFNPQGPQYQKAALKWAEPTPLDDRSFYWMSVQLATTYGLSKKSFEERADWINQDHNRKMVIAVATDPLGNGYSLWSAADEPWNFAAICREFYECFIQRSKTFTDIFPTGIDGTCSALQLLGGMTRDQKTCELVNCVSNHAPSDAYAAVLNRTIELIEADEGISFPVDKIRGVRALTKTPVMTRAYAAGHSTRIIQVTNALKEKKIRLAKTDEKQDELIEYLVCKIEKAMSDVIPGADAILGWFQKVARYLYEEKGMDHIKIPTASGNVLCHHYVVEETARIRTEGFGDVNRMPRIVETDEEGIPIGDPDIDGGVRALGANLVHGAGDAAMLQLALHDAPDLLWATTHDCVYAPCGRTLDEIGLRLRKAFITICLHNTLQHFCDANGITDNPPPIIGDYEPDDVLSADYFYS